MNAALEDNPSIINDDATGEGWIFKMKIADTSVLDDFMSEAEYKEFIG